MHAKNIHKAFTYTHAYVRVSPPANLQLWVQLQCTSRSSPHHPTSPAHKISLQVWLDPTSFRSHFVSSWLKRSTVGVIRQTTPTTPTHAFSRPQSSLWSGPVIALFSPVGFVRAGESRYNRRLWDRSQEGRGGWGAQLLTAGKHAAIRPVMYAGGWGVSVTDACLQRGFFFPSNHECFHNQSGNKRANTHAAPRVLMTLKRRWHHSRKAVGESRSDGGRLQDVFLFFFSDLGRLWWSHVKTWFWTFWWKMLDGNDDVFH